MSDNTPPERDPVIRRAAKSIGSYDALGAALGITGSAVSLWKRIPAERVVEIERVTGIPRHELRPDLHLAPPEAA